MNSAGELEMVKVVEATLEESGSGNLQPMWTMINLTKLISRKER